MVVTTVGAVGGEGWAPAGEGLIVAAHRRGGVLASVSRARMIKGPGAAGGVFLGALGRGVSKSLAVGTLGVSVSPPSFFDLEAF